MFTPIRLINFLILGIACFPTEHTLANERTVRAGSWDVTLPMQMPRRNSRTYKKEIDGPYHTLIFSVFHTESFVPVR